VSGGIESWDSVAEEWAAFAAQNDYRIHFLMPETIRLLGSVDGKKVLDFGCGEGGYSRLLAAAGAEVTGVDGSSTMVRLARTKSAERGLQVTYLVREASNLEGIADCTFDLVLAAMALMDFEDYQGAVAEAHRVLKPGGMLLASILHPCFTGRETRWRRDENGLPAHLVVDNYFDMEPWEEHIHESHFTRPVIFRHMPLQDHINLLIETGFRLSGLYEPVPSANQLEKSHRFDRLTRVPLFLFIKCQKEGQRLDAFQ